MGRIKKFIKYSILIFGGARHHLNSYAHSAHTQSFRMFRDNKLLEKKTLDGQTQKDLSL
jgi:hypothetical protein